MKEAVIEIYGRVQGINFRAIIRSYADRNNIYGSVQNMDDGSIIIIVHGSKRKIEGLIKWIKSSPGFSKVEKVEVKWRNNTRVKKGFEIIREDSILEDKMKSFFNLGKRILYGKNE